jgi:hypothetical protein
VAESRGWSRWASRLWPIALIAVLWIVFFWRFLCLPPGEAAGGYDLADMFVPWLTYFSSAVEEGHLPLWNPHLFSGVPFAANPQTGVFYPPYWLALVLPVTTALNLIVALHVLVAGIGMYAWLRAEGASQRGALVSGIVFQFSGYFFARMLAGHVGVITTHAWLPFSLWALSMAVERDSWKAGLAGGVPVAMSILAGHTASFVWVALVLTAYAVYAAWERWKEDRSWSAAARPTIPLALMLIAGLALSLLQVLPTIELVLNSTREAAPSYGFASKHSWPPGYLVTLVAPGFFGGPGGTAYWGEGYFHEFVYYIGVLPLMLALLALRVRHRLVPFLGVLGLAGLLVAFGGYGSVHSLLYRFLPIIRLMRVPARAGFLFVVAAAALAGLTVSALDQSDGEERRRLLRGLSWPAAGVAVGGAALVVIAEFWAYALAAEDSVGAQALHAQANALALSTILCLSTAGLLIAWRGAAAGRWKYWAVAVGLVALDLWSFGGSVVEPTDVVPTNFWSVAAAAIPDRQQARVLPWGLGYRGKNKGMEFGFRSVIGYDPLVLTRYDQFVGLWPDPRARTYDLLNARYLVSQGPLDFPEDGWPESPRLIHQQFTVYVYERPGALPKAWVATEVLVQDGASILATIRDPAFDPLTTALVEEQVACESPSGSEADASSAEVVRYEPNGMEVLVNSGGGLLIVSEVYYPGWRATIDGVPAELVRTDYILRGLCVPAGQHTVELVYDPPLLKVGLAITAITAVLLIGLGLWWVVVPLRRRGMERQAGRDGGEETGG